MRGSDIIDWLLEGDVSIQYQVHRDLLEVDRPDLQGRIGTEGWGQNFLAERNSNGHWGQRFYQPKWISTHYTLLDLRNLNLPPDNPIAKDALQLVLDEPRADDGGISLGPSTLQHSDVCVNAMFLNYASYFKTPEDDLKPIVNSILKEIMPDGGFNCRSTRSGAHHSSLHSSISVLEGFHEFLIQGNHYRKDEIQDAIHSTVEFILLHQLYRSDHTGAIISPAFLKLAYPSRWRYDILRALDFFRFSKQAWDSRMQDSIEVLWSKRNKLGTWNMQAAHTGQQHFVMEPAGKPGRWNTLRALRVLKHYQFYQEELKSAVA